MSAKDILRRWKGDVGVALAVRRARMAQHCLPVTTAGAGYVVYGEVGDEEGGREAAEGAVGAYIAGAGEGLEAPGGL